MKKLRIGDIRWLTSAEGPGERTALWTQGCSIQCALCCNPELFEITGGQEWSSQDLTEAIRQKGSPKLTIVGGEPLDQAEALQEFLLAFRELLGDQADIWLFSGYRWEQIIREPSWHKAVQAADMLIAGPYLMGQTPDERKWIGSKNQSIHAFTSKARDFVDQWPKNSYDIEIEIRGDEILLSGWPIV